MQNKKLLELSRIYLYLVHKEALYSLDPMLMYESLTILALSQTTSHPLFSRHFLTEDFLSKIMTYLIFDLHPLNHLRQ